MEYIVARNIIHPPEENITNEYMMCWDVVNAQYSILAYRKSPDSPWNFYNTIDIINEVQFGLYWEYVRDIYDYEKTNNDFFLVAL